MNKPTKDKPTKGEQSGFNPCLMDSSGIDCAKNGVECLNALFVAICRIAETHTRATGDTSPAWRQVNTLAALGWNESDETLEWLKSFKGKAEAQEGKAMNKTTGATPTTSEWRCITPREAEEIAFRLRFLAAGVSEGYEEGDRLSEDAVCGLIYLLGDIADMLAPPEPVQQKKEGEE